MKECLVLSEKSWKIKVTRMKNAFWLGKCVAKIFVFLKWAKLTWQRPASNHYLKIWKPRILATRIFGTLNAVGSALALKIRKAMSLIPPAADHFLLIFKYRNDEKSIFWKFKMSKITLPRVRFDPVLQIWASALTSAPNSLKWFFSIVKIVLTFDVCRSLLTRLW